MESESTELPTAVFAGGCFWCVEAVFRMLSGVTEVVSGYAGGTEATAFYEVVCSGSTEHAEAVRITYDPKKTTYEELLEVFFVSHDPTTPNQQGADVGPQYRSAIFYSDEAEKAAARAFIVKLDRNGGYPSPIVTTLEPLDAFYPAEEHHQDFARRNPSHPYVRFNALPKIEKVKKLRASK